MTPEEFLKKVIEVQVPLFHIGTSKDRRRDVRVITFPRDKISLDDFVHIKWRTGGDWGGSCWDEGDRTPNPIDGEQEPDLNDLETIILAFDENISYVKYKQLMSVVKYDTETNYEYYGNYTTYGTKEVVLRDLYNRMVELKLI